MSRSGDGLTACTYVYESLRDEASSWPVVHVGSMLFVGLMGAALYLSVRDVPGVAAWISSLAIGPLVLFYAAGGSDPGCGHRRARRARQRRARGAARSRGRYRPTAVRRRCGRAADRRGGGGVGCGSDRRCRGLPPGGRAVRCVDTARAVGDRRVAGRPRGPVGLLCSAGAVALLAYSQRAAPAVEGAAPA